MSYLIYICPNCKSPEIEETAWVDVNSGVIQGSGHDGPRDIFWCRNCEVEQSRLEEAEFEGPQEKALEQAAEKANRGCVHTENKHEAH